MTYFPGNVRAEVAFTPDSTEGRSQQVIDWLNSELAVRLKHIKPYTDDWFHAARRFHEEIDRAGL